MTKLLAVISPAKSLNDQVYYPKLICTQPVFLEEAQQLVSKLAEVSSAKLAEMMDLSTALADLNKKRYQEWHLPFTHKNAHPAILMFKGEVYRGLKAEELSSNQLDFAQNHLRIISGLYGILKPLDLVMPYRLMMGTPFTPDTKNKNLYSFWKEKITSQLNSEIDSKGVLVNLASEEYFKSIEIKSLNCKVIHCEFKERKGDKISIIGTYAKLARGMMARYIIENKIIKISDIKAFDAQGYLYRSELSTDDKLVFLR